MMNIKILAHLITSLFVFLIGFLSIEILDNYGWLVFIFLPIVVGYLPVFLIGKKQNLRKSEAIAQGFLSLIFVCVLMLIFAIEGLICIGMASPLLAFLVYLGAYLAYKIQSKQIDTSKMTFTLLVLFSCCFMAFDEIDKSQKLIEVKTEVLVNANINTVWDNVVVFDEIDEPKDWIFKTGIAYPINAKIEGSKEDAIRYCNFTTGSFVEPITKWQEPTLLQFDVVEQPAPMREVNPFWNIHPKHLNGYFRSYKGQFELERVSENKTKLKGTTFYKVEIYPLFYWKTWSDFIIHRIHIRVLNHIKKTSESNL